MPSRLYETKDHANWEQNTPDYSLQKDVYPKNPIYRRGGFLWWNRFRGVVVFMRKHYSR
jgi:hypothetical protein